MHVGRPPRSILSFFSKVKPATASAGTPIKSEPPHQTKCEAGGAQSSYEQPKPPPSTRTSHAQSGTPAVSHGQRDSPQAALPTRKGRVAELSAGVKRVASNTRKRSPAVPTRPHCTDDVIDVTEEDEDEPIQRPAKLARDEGPGTLRVQPCSAAAGAAGSRLQSDSAVQGHVLPSRANSGNITCSHSAESAHWSIAGKAEPDSGHMLEADEDMVGAGEADGALCAGLHDGAAVHHPGFARKGDQPSTAAGDRGAPRGPDRALSLAERPVDVVRGGTGNDSGCIPAGTRFPDACVVVGDATIDVDVSSGSPVYVGALKGAGTDSDGLGTSTKWGHDRGSTAGEGKRGGEGARVGTQPRPGVASVGKENGGSGLERKRQGERGVEGKGRGSVGKAAKKLMPGKQTHEECVSTLMAMGFTSLQVERALKVTQGDLERAANWLLVGM